MPFLEYKSYAKDTTLALRKSVETHAKQAGLYQYLNNSQISKEQVALRQAADHKREQGLSRCWVVSSRVRSSRCVATGRPRPWN